MGIVVWGQSPAKGGAQPRKEMKSRCPGKAMEKKRVFTVLNSNCLPQVADVRGGYWDIIFLVVKNDGLKIGYKIAHKMKAGHYFFEIFVKSLY